MILRGGYDKLAFVDPRKLTVSSFFGTRSSPAVYSLGCKSRPLGDCHAVLDDLPAFLSTTFINHNDFPREVSAEAIIRFVEENLLNSQ